MHRRRHGRIRTPGLACHLSPGDRFGNALSVDNLSMGGAFIRTPHPLREGSAVMLDFSRPGAPHALRLTGRVVSSMRGGLLEFDVHPGMGICFDPLPKDSENRLRSLLQSIVPGPMVLEGDRPNEPPARAPPVNFRPLEAVATLRPSSPTLRFERTRLGPSNQVIGLVEDSPESPYEPPKLMTVPVAKPASVSPPAPAAAPRPVEIPAQRVAAPVSTASSPPVAAPDPSKLMVQIRGLLLEISDWQYKADLLEREKSELADEVARLKAEIERLSR